jgi:hypothetical protein
MLVLKRVLLPRVPIVALSFSAQLILPPLHQKRKKNPAKKRKKKIPSNNLLQESLINQRTLASDLAKKNRLKTLTDIN